MALSTEGGFESETQQWVHDSLAALGQRLAAKGLPMQGKVYVTTDQWFNGFRTVDYGEQVTLSDAAAAPLLAGGYVKLYEPAPESVTDGTEKLDEKPAAPAPQNRVVTTQGTAGPKGKK